MALPFSTKSANPICRPGLLVFRAMAPRSEWATKKLGWRVLHELTTTVTPETLLPRHRELIARKYDGRRRHGPGRPRVQDEVQPWAARMATENRDWGYPRMQDALANLGHEAARGTITNLIKEFFRFFLDTPQSDAAGRSHPL